MNVGLQVNLDFYELLVLRSRYVVFALAGE